MCKLKVAIQKDKNVVINKLHAKDISVLAVPSKNRYRFKEFKVVDSKKRFCYGISWFVNEGLCIINDLHIDFELRIDVNEIDKGFFLLKNVYLQCKDGCMRCYTKDKYLTKYKDIAVMLISYLYNFGLV